MRGIAWPFYFDMWYQDTWRAIGEQIRDAYEDPSLGEQRALAAARIPLAPDALEDDACHTPWEEHRVKRKAARGKQFDAPSFVHYTVRPLIKKEDYA